MFFFYLILVNHYYLDNIGELLPIIIRTLYNIFKKEIS